VRLIATMIIPTQDFSTLKHSSGQNYEI
jgi:hypothetical protein